VVVLQENSRFAIEKYDYNKKKVAESSSVMSLLSGSMRFITGVIGGTRKEAIALKAGTATIGIRGTDLAINLGGNTYVVTVQNGNVVLTLQNQTVSVAQGQGTTGNTAQPPAAARPVAQLPPAVVTLVAAVTAQATPPTNPVAVVSQSVLVKAVEKAKAAAEKAKAPDATPADKAAAQAAAADVQTAVTGALQATRAAIQQAIQAGAPQTAAVGTPSATGSQPGVRPPVNTTPEAVQIINQVNQTLPPDIQLAPPPANLLPPPPTTTTTTTTDATQPPPPTTQEQLNTIDALLPPPPPPTQPPACGTSCA